MLSGFSIDKSSLQTYSSLELYHLKTNLNLLCQKQYSLANLELQILACNKESKEINVLIKKTTTFFWEIMLVIIKVSLCPGTMNVPGSPDSLTSKKKKKDIEEL